MKIKVWRGQALLAFLWIARAITRLTYFQKAYHALIYRLVDETGLFDSRYYLETGSYSRAQYGSPLRHYVVAGDRNGCSPMAFFDPSYYRSHASGRARFVNAVLHYSYIGRYLGVSPSPWFDVQYYLSNNKDVERSNIDPLIHYLNFGGKEGRSPCPQFDSAYYLQDNKEVLEAGLNPLTHYLLYGRVEGRSTLLSVKHHQRRVLDQVIRDFEVFDSEEWGGLEARGNVSDADVDVIVPIYAGKTETLRCLYSVLSSASTASFELIVINDFSPEESLVHALVELSNMGLFTLLSNNQNMGFVKTVNSGMRQHDERDVVLLNSDTEVYDCWLDRLCAASLRNEKTATITPFSNNATICSYPHSLYDNPYPLEISYSSLDEIVAEVNSGSEIVTPTGVGFCMYVKRACLDEIGLFDEEAFGRGYGEENDFCQRAIQHGWRNIIATDVFVRHWGSVSFKGEKSGRIQNALKIVSGRYPNYHNDISKFIKLDPIAAARNRIDWARLKRMQGTKNILIVSHNRGGGAERCVQEDIQLYSSEDCGVFLLRPMRNKPTEVVLSHPSVKSSPNIAPFSLTNPEELVLALQDLCITDIHTHSFVDYVHDAPLYLQSIVKSLRARWEANLHDYKVICPRINLVGKTGVYCGEPVESECNRCLLENGSDFNVTDIKLWRSMHSKLLSAADKVLVPDQDVSVRLSNYFPEVSFVISPHESLEIGTEGVSAPKLLPQERLRVVVIGAISKIKGYNVLLACANDAKKRNLPLDYIVMGYTHNDRLLEKAGVTITGRYLEEDAERMLLSLAPHVVFLPSVWPETYSYTLSLALKGSYPVFAFSLGAINRRLISEGQTDTLLPLSDSYTPFKINSKIIGYRA